MVVSTVLERNPELHFTETLDLDEVRVEVYLVVAVVTFFVYVYVTCTDLEARSGALSRGQ